MQEDTGQQQPTTTGKQVASYYSGGTTSFHSFLGLCEPFVAS
jgi:hypothetical protein